MKKITTSIFLVLFSVLAVQSAQAQFKAGVGLMYGSEVEQLGIRVDGVYTINEQFRGVADFGYYFPEDMNGGSINYWELNINGNYMFFSDPDQGLNAYALAGLNFFNASVEIDGFGSSSSNETGLNLGAGLEYNLDFAELFAEAKFVISDADQLNIGAGLRFPF
jgi:opacity protein-like surface antigen